MCKCTPNIRTPWCGKQGCEVPKQVSKPTPQNLPALIKEMQKRAQDKAERGYLAHTYKAVGKQGSFIPVEELDTHTTDTANATLEYVKGVIQKQINIHKQLAGEWTGISTSGLQTTRINPHQERVEELEDLLARLTSNPQ
jgi:hypothetical protein